MRSPSLRITVPGASAPGRLLLRCALRDRGLHEQAVQPPLQRRLEARAGIVPVESRAERVSGVWSLV